MPNLKQNLQWLVDAMIGAGADAKTIADVVTSLGADITTPTEMPAGGVGIRGWLSAIYTKLNASLAVTGTFWQATQSVSATALPLPDGAATAAKQLADGHNVRQSNAADDGAYMQPADNAVFPVKLNGAALALKAATVITTDGTVNGTPVTGLDIYTLATILLTISAKTMDASTTLDVYLQYSPDGGTTWDDIAHFAQVTSAAIGGGTYVLFLNANGPAAVDRVTDAAATLAANSVRSIDWCDRLRVTTVAANFADTDTITVKVEGYFK